MSTFKIYEGKDKDNVASCLKTPEQAVYDTTTQEKLSAKMTRHEEKLNNAVEIGDYDPSLRAGVADTAYDVIQDNTETETFTSRVVGNTSGGHAITKGNASVKVMKGNSVVWNQYVKNVTTTSSGVTFTFANGKVTINGTMEYGVSYNVGSINDTPSGHKVLAISPYLRFIDGYTGSDSAIFTAGSHISMYLKRISENIVNEEPFSIIDLTKWYNGNVPSGLTAEQFIALNPQVLTMGYNEGTLISNNATSIRSKDNNGAVLATRPTLIKSIKDAQGNVVFPNGLLKAGSVADSIDYRAGKAVKRVGIVDLGSLSWSLNYNVASQYCFVSEELNQLKIAGSVISDSLISDEFASVVNDKEGKNIIAVRPNFRKFVACYGKITNPDSFKSAMSGVIAYYELATPIEYTFDPSHLDYPIVNGGVEELVAEGNVAPIVADITYPCSQNGTIASLLARISALESQLVSTTNVTEE